MSLSEELPLYKDTLKLLNLTLEKTKSYTIYYRYTLGEKMININWKNRMETERWGTLIK